MWIRRRFESAMAAAKLTGNAVAAAMAGDTNLKPVVQVVDLRSIAVTGAPGSGPRFRAIISDGVATGHALFASQLCDLARSGVVRRGSVVQLLDYIVNNVGPTRNRKYLSLPSSAPPTRLDRSVFHLVALLWVWFMVQAYQATRHTKLGLICLIMCLFVRSSSCVRVAFRSIGRWLRIYQRMYSCIPLMFGSVDLFAPSFQSVPVNGVAD